MLLSLGNESLTDGSLASVRTVLADNWFACISAAEEHAGVRNGRFSQLAFLFIVHISKVISPRNF